MPLFVMVADLFGFSFLLLWVLQFDCLTHSTRRKLLHNDFRLMLSCGQLQYAYAYTTTAVVPGSRDQREQVRKVGAGCQRGNTAGVWSCWSWLAPHSPSTCAIVGQTPFPFCYYHTSKKHILVTRLLSRMIHDLIICT